MLDALHDLTHEPMTAERIAFAAQAHLEEAVEELEALSRKFREGVENAIAASDANASTSEAAGP